MSSLKDFEHLKIPLSDIIQATRAFSNAIGDGGFGYLYKGKLFGQTLAFERLDHHQDESDFCNEIMFLSNLKHQNIVSLIGFCHEDREMILVFDFPTYRSLERYLSSAHLTWLMRVQICLDTACGLRYIHENPSQRIIHGDLTSDSIQLDENWQAKLRVSRLRNVQVLSTIYNANLDPEYLKTGKLTTQSDIYSFGVILFEVLCGRLAYMMDKDNELPFLSLVRRHYTSGTLTEIIDPVLRVQMNRDSLNVFSMLAYQCLEDIRDERPTISAVVEGLEKVLRLQKGFEMSELQQVQNIQHMKIPLEEIRSATCNFTIPHKTGKVYKAELSHFDVDRYVAENKIKRVSMEEILEYARRKSTVAIKSIDGGYGKRTEELLQMLLNLSHENLVKLVGFCDEDDDHIHVVYEYASNGSLDGYIHRQHINYQNYITNPTNMRNIFPWVIRLQFCLDAARGLNILHNGNGKNDPIIHGNIKSSNILISREGVGMIGDFGLSTNQNTRRLTKEYDVFSFGLVLYEVMSKDQLTHFKPSKDDQELLPDVVKLGFNRRKLNNIIDPMLQKEFEKDHGSSSTLEDSIDIFAKITYDCFAKVEKRPTMANIVEQLEKAYRRHVESLEKRQKAEDKATLLAQIDNEA